MTEIVSTPGGVVSWAVEASAWNGGSAKLQYRPEGLTNWRDVTGYTTAADASFSGVYVGRGHLQTTVTGAPTGLVESISILRGF